MEDAASSPVLLIVSERPELFSAVRPLDVEVHQWRPHLPDGASPSHLHLFAGDPTEPETYRSFASKQRDAVAVLDLHGAERAFAALRALRTVSPETALLVLWDRDVPAFPEDALVRHVAWSDLLRLDLEFELARLDLRRRVQRLRRFAEEVPILPIYLQMEPDPDAIASALAVRRVLGRRDSTAPIVSLGRITRPENRRMVELLRLPVTQVTPAELRRFDRLIAVDVQPQVLEGSAVRLAVIDHHPPEDGYSAELLDIRPDYGATATILTEYLRAIDERRIGRRLATALLYGIQTDTARLSRGVSTADVDAYAFLHARADHALLKRIAQPSHSASAMRTFGRALAELRVERDLAVAHLGTVDAERLHLVADLADFCLSLEGAAWVAVGARVGGELEIALRHRGPGLGAGALAHRLAGKVGSGGGHASMARVSLPITEVDPSAAAIPSGPSVRSIRDDVAALAAWVRRELDRSG